MPQEEHFPGPRAGHPAKYYFAGNPSLPHKGWHERGYLPHFDARAVVQMVTFRLADSLPRSVYEEILSKAKDDLDRLTQLDAMIDEGRGACLLRLPEHAATVRDALQYFDGVRYRLLAWVIMPNHVHALIEQIEGFRLGDIVQAWKSFTAKEINKRRSEGGAIWARDYFDRFIRDEPHLAAAILYIEENPVKAGLLARPQDWPYSSAAHARGTRAVPI